MSSRGAFVDQVVIQGLTIAGTGGPLFRTWKDEPRVLASGLAGLSRSLDKGIGAFTVAPI